MPWVLVDFKLDDHIQSLIDMRKAQEIDSDFVPGKKDTGLYVLRPMTGPQGDEAVKQYLWKLHQRENVGLFCDELFMIGNSNDAFDAIQTQGRSKRIPCIGCSQRPAWISRYCFSEASFVQCFDLNDAGDKRRVQEFMPVDFDTELAEHESWYFDIGRKALARFHPVPDMKAIREIFDRKLLTRRTHI
jgi:hypothetical protein